MPVPAISCHLCDVAERFLSQAEGSFNDLARQPMMGAPVQLKRPDLASM